MRAALLAVLAIAAPASADSPKHYPKLGVFNNTVKKLPPGVKTLAPVSHVLYLNDCKPNGCVVSPGFDDSRSNHSSIAEGQRTMSAFSYGDQYWANLVNCAKDTFAQFDVEITTVDPGNAPHFEVMIGGRALQLNSQLQGAGGVAPFIDCNTSSDSIISFVFSDEVNDLEFLCGAIAQEASHVWGLDHELDAKDPMTYLDLGTLKRFQNNNASCGEDSPRECFCGGPTQNSVQFLNNAFGPKNLTPATVTITSPADNQFVKPGFTVRATLDSQLSFTSGQLSVDGAQAQTISNDPIVFNAPTSLTGGSHTVEVAVTDSGNRTVTDSVTVQVMQSCSAAAPNCPTSFGCLGGFCLPTADQAGALGAECTANDQCVTNQCSSDGSEQHCAAPCDSGNACPSGFQCIDDGGAGTCWPGSPDSGGCATSNGAPGFLLLGLGFVVALRRRRR